MVACEVQDTEKKRRKRYQGRWTNTRQNREMGNQKESEGDVMRNENGQRTKEGPRKKRGQQSTREKGMDAKDVSIIAKF